METRLLKKLLAILALLSITVSSSYATSKLNTPKEIAEEISAKLQKGWECHTDFSLIVIRKKADVILYNPMGRPTLLSEEFCMKEGVKGKYLITLDFRKKLQENEYNQLVKLKKDFASIDSILDLDLMDTKNNEKKEKPQPNVLKYISLPTYFNNQYSVYVHRTDKRLNIFPRKARTEIESIFKLIESHLEKYSPF